MRCATEKGRGIYEEVQREEWVAGWLGVWPRMRGCVTTRARDGGGASVYVCEWDVRRIVMARLLWPIKERKKERRAESSSMRYGDKCLFRTDGVGNVR